MSRECFVFKPIIRNKIKIKQSSKINLCKNIFQQSDPYKHHVDRMRNIKAQTDHKPPGLMLSMVCPVTEYRRSNERLTHIMKENLHLLGKLNDISRSHSVYSKDIDSNCKNVNHSRLLYRLKVIGEKEKQNFRLGDRIITVTGEIPTNKKLKKDWENKLIDIKRKCQHKVILPELLRKKPYVSVEKNRPTVYLEVGQKHTRPLGRLIILLYLDLAPITCKNFIDLCENHRNWINQNTYNNKLDTKSQNSYNPNNNNNKKKHHIDYDESISQDCKLIGTKFTRIFPNLLIYAGKLFGNNKKSNFHGIPDYKPEKCQFHHGYKGTLSMVPMHNNLINSEFTISLKPLHVFDGKRLAFGRIIRGLSILDNISSYGTKNGKPQKTVEILDCGIVNLNLE